jgi:hypothetical protein
MLQTEDCLSCVVSFLTIFDTVTKVRLVCVSWNQLFNQYLPHVKISLRHEKLLPYLGLANIKFFTNRKPLADERCLDHLPTSLQCIRLNACANLTTLDFSRFFKLRVLILDNYQANSLVLAPALGKLHLSFCNFNLDSLLQKLPATTHTLVLKCCKFDTPSVNQASRQRTGRLTRLRTVKIIDCETEDNNYPVSVPGFYWVSQLVSRWGKPKERKKNL